MKEIEEREEERRDVEGRELLGMSPSGTAIDTWTLLGASISPMAGKGGTSATATNRRFCMNSISYILDHKRWRARGGCTFL